MTPKKVAPKKDTPPCNAKIAEDVRCLLERGHTDAHRNGARTLRND